MMQTIKSKVDKRCMDLVWQKMLSNQFNAHILQAKKWIKDHREEERSESEDEMPLGAEAAYYIDENNNKDGVDEGGDNEERL